MTNYEEMQLVTNISVKIFKIEDNGETTWIKALSTEQAIECYKNHVHDYEIEKIEEVTGEDLYKKSFVDSEVSEETYVSLAELQKKYLIPSVIACSVW
jgi:cell division protein FtsI/penicillin-binding protein 2